MFLLEELKRRNVIRVGLAYLAVAWLLIQIADAVLPAFEVSPDAVRLLLILLAIGFLPALIFAWVYEVTPEGIKKEAEVDRERSVAGHTARRLDRVIIVVLALALAFFALDKFVLDPQRDASRLEAAREEAVREEAARHPALADLAADDKKVAVLPFVAMSSGEDDGYFADGLTEEILNALSALPELLVTARTSSFHFKGTSLTIPEIALKLGVGHVVEGSVRRSGDRVRITAQLVRASDGFHHWSQTYERTLDDVFAVQQDIAENIAAVLDVALDAEDRERMRRAGIPAVGAFIAYQKGLELFANAHTEVDNISGALAEANAYFERALEAAPGLVQARVLKADQAGHALYEIAVGFREPTHPGEAAEARAALREEYIQALRLAPRSAERAVLEAEHHLFSDSWQGLPAKMDAAMRPGDCRKVNWIAEVAGPFGWADELVAVMRASGQCDPLNVVSRFVLPWALVWAGDPEAALGAVEEAEAAGVYHPWLEEGRITALRALGRLDEADGNAPGELLNSLQVRRGLLTDAQRGAASAREEVAAYADSARANDRTLLILAAVVGDRELANATAARIDGHPASAFVLSEIVFSCFCGAPFELDATPNFEARLEEAGLPWPPPSPIHYPNKDW